MAGTDGTRSAGGGGLERSWRPEITDEGIADDAPMIRAEMLRRLEALWSACLPHITGEEKPDVRFVEAGVRIVDRISRLYRLDAPGRALPDPGVGEDAVATVLAVLEAAEVRLSGQSGG